MFSSKLIKIFCWVILSLACLGAMILAIYGLSLLGENTKSGLVLFFISPLLPIFTLVSLYTIFALANIDENLAMLNRRVDRIEYRLSPAAAKQTVAGTASVNETASNQAIGQEIKNDSGNVTKDKDAEIPTDAILFINKRYNTALDVNDSLQTIKEKIAGITVNSTSANILIRKISKAEDLAEVRSIVQLHMAANR